MAKARRMRVTYCERYRGTFVKDEELRERQCSGRTSPPLNYGATVDVVQVNALGRCEMGGEQYEFVDVRIFSKVPSAADPR